MNNKVLKLLFCTMIFATNDNYPNAALSSELSSALPDNRSCTATPKDLIHQAFDSINIAKNTLEDFVKTVRTYI